MAISVIGRARAAWGFTRCKEDPARRLMVPLKNNLAADQEGLAYSITDGAVEWESEPIEISADEAFLPVRKARSPDALKRAKEWLEVKLADGEWHLIAAIDSEAKEKGFSQITLKRAKQSLKPELKRAGGNGPWECRMSKEELLIPTGSF